MAILTASQGVNLGSLNILLSMFGGTGNPSHTDTTFQISNTTYQFDGTGVGLAYAVNDLPSGGTITGLTISTVAGPTQLYSLTGLNLDVGYLILYPLQILTLIFGGPDTLNGSAQVDQLFGFGGKDTMFGNGSADVLTGGIAGDTMNGGAAADRFDYNFKNESTVAAFDTIVAFSHAQHDRIDLRDIDPIQTTSANEAFKFIGAQTFLAYRLAHLTGKYGLVRDAGNFIEIDINGNNTVDMRIKVAGLAAVGGDFFL